MLQCTPENGRRHTYQPHHRDQTMRSRTPLQFASRFQLSTADLQLFRTNSFRLIQFTKNASANPLDSALTSKRASKSFTSNTYEKHTQGGGGSPEFRVSSFGAAAG